MLNATLNGLTKPILWPKILIKKEKFEASAINSNFVLTWQQKFKWWQLSFSNPLSVIIHRNSSPLLYLKYQTKNKSIPLLQFFHSYYVFRVTLCCDIRIRTQMNAYNCSTVVHQEKCTFFTMAPKYQKMTKIIQTQKIRLQGTVLLDLHTKRAGIIQERAPKTLFISGKR